MSTAASKGAGPGHARGFNRRVVLEAIRLDGPLSRGAIANTLQAVRMELSRVYGDSVSVQAYSGETKQGVDEARAVVAGWLGV